MFSLFYGLWSYLFSKAEFHLLIVGLDDAGKTVGTYCDRIDERMRIKRRCLHVVGKTLLEQLKGIYSKKASIPLDKIPPTVGLNIARVDIRRSRVIFWDLGGQIANGVLCEQEQLRAIWNKYYSESHGIVFVIDSAHERRFQEAKETLHAMLSNSELSGVPVLVLANKMDMENARSENYISEILELEAYQGVVATYSICALTRCASVVTHGTLAILQH
ncbi:hypothetical protein PsorP6_012814 [Peronosclerospora sorghi]|uniref:Uncharacterized protein n=1 Tax=Peronosclerospora sorghi TaxID=230839 RepID=A0ACC0WJF6_9STRA|nr:hypothetical protein PsorP6_012814 [Peronosclerospora sorghi]